MQFSDNQKRTLLGVVAAKERIALDQEAIRDDVKSLAEQTGLKPGQINRIVSLVIKERKTGDILRGESDIIDMAESVLQ